MAYLQRNLSPLMIAVLSGAVLFFVSTEARAGSCAAYFEALLEADLVIDNSTSCNIVTASLEQYPTLEFSCIEEEISPNNCVLIGIECPPSFNEFLEYFAVDSSANCGPAPTPTIPPTITTCSGGARTDASGQTCGTAITSVGGVATNSASGSGQGAGSGPAGGGCPGGCCTATAGGGSMGVSGGGVGPGGGGGTPQGGLDPCNVSNGAEWHMEQTVSIPGRTPETALTLNRT
jgi:hypothetical protein